MARSSRSHRGAAVGSRGRVRRSARYAAHESSSTCSLTADSLYRMRAPQGCGATRMKSCPSGISSSLTNWMRCWCSTWLPEKRLVARRPRSLEAARSVTLTTDADNSPSLQGIVRVLDSSICIPAMILETVACKTSRSRIGPLTTAVTPKFPEI